VSFDWKGSCLAAEVANYLAEAMSVITKNRQLDLSGRGVASLRQESGGHGSGGVSRRRMLFVAFKREHRLIDLSGRPETAGRPHVRLNEASIDADVDEMSARAAIDFACGMGRRAAATPPEFLKCSPTSPLPAFNWSTCGPGTNAGPTE